MTRPILLTPMMLCLVACAPASRGASIHLGTWDCGVTQMRFTETSYIPSPGADPLPIALIEPLTGENVRISLENGDAMVVQHSSPDLMTWFSEQTGDSFACTRTGP